ncbi:response regulator [Anaerocolumna sedimenticola]|uniref:Stage 0 sporulation protein A homolog n=1 Tax=Anaerocolumna sedimenticola TaxID=2696063 RepID=A0A6P1TMZ6_9FIRM|nr:response regulator [Anaerocolumna sedimenticola]QHQ61843.1 response regulator [Anaerocolumna sedimenticola]
MKVLIADDEKLTREGIISNLDWKKLGIDEIYEADDGYNGIELSKIHKPDIILSDVRMPRMNGIEMAKELQKILPNSSIIFMSGYSDKEYLKEAIKLKVISYVEKPIDAAELEDSIKLAMEEQFNHVKNQIKTEYHNKYSQNKLALQIIYPLAKENQTDYIRQFEELGYTIKPATDFTTVIITLKTAVSSISEQDMNELYYTIDEIVTRFHMNYILAVKNDEYLILHLFSANKAIDYGIRNTCLSISSYLNKSYQYFIAVGKTVKGIKNVFESYNSAVVLLQSSFFYDYNSIIVPEAAPPKTPVSDHSIFNEYLDALTQHNREEITKVVTAIFQNYKENQHVLPNQVKDLYYKLFNALIQTASNLHVPAFFEEDSWAVLEYVTRNYNLIELHQLLLDKINLLFSYLQEHTKDNATIYAIKEFISKNYQNETLSVKDISEHVYLSSSYVCTLFKNETGKTLNQYLTEYRIDKAKNMLMDSRIKITDISAKVGYSDSNYFGKAFKKIVDLSPSEYRERFGK